MASIGTSWRARVQASAVAPFGHVDHPLRNTFHHPGDPGLCGPESVSWSVIGDVAAFVGGIRALLVQSVHPEVVAGVKDHSRYRDDPFGRLSRTSAYVTATTFGSTVEARQAVGQVQEAHAGVVGRSHRGKPYSARSPSLAAWTHNVLTESFLATHRVFGAGALSEAEEDSFVAEQARIGKMLDADPLPREAEHLSRWVEHHPELGPSPGMEAVVRFLSDPPFSGMQRLGYEMLFRGAVSTLPARISTIIGLRRGVADRLAGRASVRLLRSALGYSPSWKLALIRSGAPVPEGLFRYDPPVEIPSGGSGPTPRV